MNLKGFYAALLLCVAAKPALAEIEVVASIKPLQLIAKAVVGDLGEPEVLVPIGASPHNYSLKPSERRMLSQADLVVWAGPQLEMFLEKTLHSSQAPALALLPEDDHAGETAEEHAAHADDDHGHDHHGHDHGGIDPHFWMNPMDSLQAAEQIAARLADRYPQHKAVLEQNLMTFTQNLIKADRQLKAELAPLADRGFFVFHDAYSRFTDRYQLKMLGAFTVDPGRPVGTRHLAEIREQLKADAAVCVFGEPQFKAAVVNAVTADLSVGYGELDPLGQSVEVSTQGYIDFLNQLGAQVKSCLNGGQLAQR